MRSGWWVLLGLAGCAGDEVEFSGEELLAEIDGYEEWAQPEGWAGPVPSCDGTHGEQVDIWTNTIAAADLAAGTTPFRDGAILVKQGYAADGTPQNLTVMRKLTGFDPDNGDWFWGQYDDAGNELAAGAVSGCTGCHAGATTDHVLYPDSPVVTDASECP